MDTDNMIKRFLGLTADCYDDELLAAMSWYDNAHDLACRMTDMGVLTFDQSCVAIAAYSIRQQWEVNVRNALTFARGETPKAMGVCNRIAENALRFDDPYTALNGEKTYSFAKNISGDRDAVTIDVWMLRAAGLDHKKTPTPKQYREIAQAVRDAADEDPNLLFPREYQALVWLKIRGG